MKANHRWIPWALAAMFLPVAAVNGLLVKLALSSNTGLVSDNAFDTGQSYNQIIAAGQKQQALGWKAVTQLQPLPAADSPHRARLIVSLRDATGAPLHGLKVSGRLYSPVDPQPDQAVSLTESGDGQYRQDLSLPRGGQWDAQLMAWGEAKGFAIEQRLVLF
jgi:nitrogen fixation protein FixH